MTLKWRAGENASYFTSAMSGTTYTTPPTSVNYGTRLQVTDSEGNPYGRLGRNNSEDIGGAFETIRLQVHLGVGCYPRTLRQFNTGGAVLRDYHTFAVPDGVVKDAIRVSVDKTTLSLANAYFNPWRTAHAPSEFTMGAWGSTVINSVKPTNPTVDLAVSIAEFVSERKFFSLPGSAGSLPGEYLNFMFGVAPLISDVQDLRKAIENQEKILDQYTRDSGRRIRRRFDAEPDVTSGFTVTPNVYPIYHGTGPVTALQSRGTLTVHTKKTQKWSFSGAFTYYLPKEGFTRDLALLDKLYGVKPGSELIWELLPFSWLADYKTSMGASLSNFDSFIQDGLVMPYAYVMCTTTVVTEHTWEGALMDQTGSMEPVRLLATVTTEQKKRLPATPFGFGILPGALSLRQKSILLALGLTKI